jgi:hypothetical protein
MKRTAFVLRLVAWAAGGVAVGFIVSHSLYALTPPRLAAAPAAIEPQTASDGHQFASDAGIMLKFIKADKTGDFEATVDKLREALARSNNPERRRQAQSWRVFKAIEPATNGDAVYVFEIDPAVRGADYTVARILAEAFPAEASSLYRRYADASSSRQHVVDLKLIAAFGDQVSR